MNKYPWLLAAIGCSVVPMLFAVPTAAGWNRHTPCAKTAIQMNRACRHEVRDDHAVALANCINLASPGERKACGKEASTAQREEHELCGDQLYARLDACDLLDEYRYDPDPLLDPGIGFVDPDDIGPGEANPYVSVVAGHTHVLHEGDEIIVVHVTGVSKEINGVPCRIVVDAAVEEEWDGPGTEVEYTAVEITDDWFAQDIVGNVYYCGELSRNFEDGELADLDGSFTAGVDFAKAGVLIKAVPEAGLAHRQEFALGEAEDIVEYLNLATVPWKENQAFPCAPAGGCLQTFDFTPLEPDASEYKYYLPGVGVVLTVALEDGEPTGERAELACVGDSLDVLHDEGCGIADPQALLSTLCELAPNAFCDEDVEP